MSAVSAPILDDRLPLWELARRWAGGDEAGARLHYARLWAGYWKREFLPDAFQFWVRAAPDEGTFISMPPTGPGGLFGLTDGEEALGRFVDGAPEPGTAGIALLAEWSKEDYDRLRSRLLRVYVDGAHLTRAGFLAWCEATGRDGTAIWPEPGQPDLTEACRIWLTTRKALRGDESRKILRDAAAKDLPGLSDMQFRQAFRDVYGRKPPQDQGSADDC